MPRRKRPDVIKSKTTKHSTGCGNIYLTLGDIDDELGEVEMKLGKPGSCVRGLLQIIGILISVRLQEDYTKGEQLRFFKKHLLEVNCGNPFTTKGEKYTSCADLLAKECIKELEREKK